MAPDRELDTILPTVNPEGVTYSLKPAGLVPRALAYLVDYGIIVVVLGALSLLGYAIDQTAGAWIYLLVLFAVQWFYHVAWEIFGKGASPGKRLFGLRVVADDGSPISPASSMIRSLLRFADSFMGLSLIGVTTLCFSPGFRRLGDWAAGSLVVYSPRRFLDSVAIRTAMPTKTRSSGKPLTGDEKAVILSFARRYNSLGTARADEIAGELASVLTETSSNPASSAQTSPGELILGIGVGLSGQDNSR